MVCYGLLSGNTIRHKKGQASCWIAQPKALDNIDRKVGVTHELGLNSILTLYFANRYGIMLRLISPTTNQHMETIPVMSSLLKNIAKMQIMLADMEAEFGIRDIGAIEKSVLSSVADLAGDARLVSTKDILQHPLNNVYSRPSLFRALKNLESLGKIAKGGKKRGLYTLVC